MRLTSEMQGNEVLVLTVNDAEKLNLNNAKEFKNQLTPLIKNNRKILLNLENVNFIDSSGLGGIIVGLKRVNEQQGEFRLVNLQKPVRLLLEITRLNKVLPAHDSLPEALEAFE